MCLRREVLNHRLQMIFIIHFYGDFTTRVENSRIEVRTGSIYKSIGLVAVSITPINDPPQIAVPPEITICEDEWATMGLNLFDPDAGATPSEYCYSFPWVLMRET